MFLLNKRVQPFFHGIVFVLNKSSSINTHSFNGMLQLETHSVRFQLIACLCKWNAQSHHWTFIRLKALARSVVRVWEEVWKNCPLSAADLLISSVGVDATAKSFISGTAWKITGIGKFVSENQTYDGLFFDFHHFYDCRKATSETYLVFPWSKTSENIPRGLIGLTLAFELNLWMVNGGFCVGDH